MKSTNFWLFAQSEKCPFQWLWVGMVVGATSYHPMRVERLLATAAWDRSVGVESQSSSYSFCKQAERDCVGGYQLMPMKSISFAPLGLHATGGQCFVRTWSRPCYRTLDCNRELRNEPLELRPGIWELSRRKLLKSKLTWHFKIRKTNSSENIYRVIAKWLIRKTCDKEGRRGLK